jgi:hypothetical protein
MAGEEILDVRLTRRVRKIPHKELFHLTDSSKHGALFHAFSAKSKGGYCSK